MLFRGSTLSPLLFNIDIFNLFFVDIASNNMNYADETSPYKCDKHCDNLISNLELTVDKIFSWFEYNNLKSKPQNAFFFYYLINALQKH